ncbi:MAG: YdbH domain-containing protein [Mariprofundaceae bacterium]|nr:YdbH domain-containing protein [Mariprofundaceae bacterium]
MKKHIFRAMLGIVLLFMAWFIAWFWWFPSWLNEKINTTLQHQGFVVESLVWQHIGLRSSELKTLRLRKINTDTRVNIHNLSIHYQAIALLNKKLTGIQVHATRVDIRWFQAADASPIALISPLPMLALMPLGLVQVDALDVSEYVQQKLRRRWHGSVKLQQGELQVRLSEVETPLFEGMAAALTVSQHGDVYASIGLGDTPLAWLQGTLDEDADTLRLKAKLSMQLAPMLDHFPVRFDKSRLKGHGVTSWHIEAMVKKGSYATPENILSSLRLNMDWDFNGSLKQAAWQAHGHIKGHITLAHHQGTWGIAIPHLTGKGKEWKAVMGSHQLKGDFRLGKGGVDVTLASPSFVRWKTLRWQTLSLDGVMLQNRAALRFTGLARTSPLDISITLPSVRWQNLQFHSKTMHLLLAAPTAHDALNGQLNIQSFQWDTPSLHLPQGDVSIQMQWDKTLRLSLNYENGQQRPWQFDVAWQPKAAKGYVDFDMAINKPEQRLKAMLPAIRPIFKKLALPLGNIRAKGRISLQVGLWQGTGQLSLKGLQGHYAKKTFNGLNADLDLDFNSNRLRLNEGSIDIATIDAGIPIRKLKAKFRANHPIGHATQLNIERLDFNILGGNVSVSNVDFDTAKLDDKKGNPFTIRVKNISLAELLALEQQQGITATGILDGYFPSNIRRAGFFVRQGRLAARPPGGVLQYAAKANMRSMTAKSLGLKLAFQVLDHFNYHQLDADVNYYADGRLLLGLHIKGKNPAYDKGRPIEFNINVEENLLTLLKSLSMADEISDQIERRVQNKENP